MTLRGMPILSKRHGVAELRLHATLAFDDQQPTPPSLDVAHVRVGGSHPALIFEDKAPAATEPARVTLVKPRGASEVHLLGGRLLLADATDARWSCGGGGGSGGLNSSEPLTTLKLGSAAGAVLELTQEENGAGGTVALAISPSGAELTVRGAVRLMVDGADVAQRHRSCASATGA